MRLGMRLSRASKPPTPEDQEAVLKLEEEISAWRAELSSLSTERAALQRAAMAEQPAGELLAALGESAQRPSQLGAVLMK